MPKSKKICLVFGTRPEAIKLAPLVIELKKRDAFEVDVCVTGQHRSMLDQVLTDFDIHPNADLAIMEPDQSLGTLTARLIASLDQYLQNSKPAMVIVQGDTTTACCGALAAYYHKIPIGHVEAGLRTGDKYAPFPEEGNRSLITPLADLHFAPTGWAQNNLLREGVCPKRIHVTGNTVIDALHLALKKTQAILGSNARKEFAHLKGSALECLLPILPELQDRKVVLITGHRRESFGRGFEEICSGVAQLAQQFPQVLFLYPVHLNPNVRGLVFQLLHPYPNISLLDPLPYLPFVVLMEMATLVLTDSGGIQEEAPSLGKPVLLMRDKTERPEGIEAGTMKLVGAKSETIVREVSRLLTDEKAYQAMATAANPYGDGRACERIASVLSGAT